MTRGGLIVALVLLSGCSLVGRIDVCDRPIGEETVVNVRTDGEQLIESLQAATPTPDENAVLVAYRSERADGSGSSITLSFVAESGEPLATCGDEAGHEITGVTPDIGFASVALAPEPNPDTDVVGLLVYTQIVSAEPAPRFEVVGVALRRSGCAFEFLSRCDQSGERFVIAVERGVPIEAPSIVAFDADGFVVTWSRSLGGSFNADSALRARRIRFDLCPDFPGNAIDSAGEAVDLLSEGNQPTRISVAPMDGEGFFALWYEERIGGFDVLAARFSEQLDVVTAPFLVASQDVPTPELLLGPVDPGFRTALAWDGEQLLAAWVSRDATGGASQVMGRFFDAEGRFLRAPGAPDGEALRLGSATSGSESFPAISALPSGGFVLTLAEQEEPGRVDTSSAGLRVTLFGADGRRSFANPVCGAEDFTLNQLTADAQTAPALTRLGDGSTAVVWNDRSQTLPDRDGSAVRLVVIPERQLLPIE